MSEQPDTMILADLDRMWRESLDRMERERWEADLAVAMSVARRSDRKTRRAQRPSYEDRLAERRKSRA